MMDKPRMVTKFKCVICGKITAGRQPWGGSTIIYPRRHKVGGKPCSGNIIEAEMIDVEQKPRK